MPFIIFAFLTLLLPGRTFAAEPAQHIETQYTLYAGGINAVDAQIAIDLTDDVYHVSSLSKTRGMIGFFYPLNATYDSKGTRLSHTDSPQLFPEHYISRKKVRSRKKEKEILYTDKGIATSKISRKNGKEVSRILPERELSDGALGYQEILLQMMLSLQKSGTCGEQLSLFDGKRRFEITVQDMGMDSLPKMEKSVFSGDAHLCRLSLAPESEKPKSNWFWHAPDKGEENPIFLWFDTLKEGYPPALVHGTVGSRTRGTLFIYLKNSAFR